MFRRLCISIYTVYDHALRKSETVGNNLFSLGCAATFRWSRDRMLPASMRRVAARISVVAFVIAAAGLLAANARAFAADTSPAHENDIPSLKTTFGARFLIGAAVEPAQIADPVDAALLRRHFSSITAENVMKPRTLGTAVGIYNYGPADELVRFAVANAIRVRGHTL